MARGHEVTYDLDNGWECDCGWYQHKGECKHIKAIKICKENNVYIPLKSDNNV